LFKINIFYISRFFLCADIKNNFKKIKNILFWYISEQKNTLNNNCYHIFKYTINNMVGGVFLKILIFFKIICYCILELF
jgi:hypothetical protein